MKRRGYSESPIHICWEGVSRSRGINLEGINELFERKVS